ncbi:MAG: hypothetical protein PHV79_03800, partial [Clostridia bacterium]|nr:hypothetical protein [Clostridia bacterium]
STNPFKGTFNGAGHIIRGLYINSTSQYQGLFGYAEGATVQNLGIENSYIKGDNSGAIIGRGDNVTITNCYNSGNVATNGYGTGGIVGIVRGISYIINCYNSGDIYGYEEAGGIVGANCGINLSIINCYNTGNIYNNIYGYYIGGIIGVHNSGVVEYCYNTGNIYNGSDGIGGIVGYNSSAVSYCYNTGNISDAGSSLGGICGENSGTVTYSHNSGTINGTPANMNNLVGGGTAAGAGCGINSISHSKTNGIIYKLNQWVAINGTGAYKNWRENAPHILFWI